MIDKINAIRAELAAIASEGAAADVEALRIKYLSKKALSPPL